MHLFKTILAITAVVFCTCGQPVYAQTQVQATLEIAVLGTFHFGPTRDLAAIRFEDIQSDKRQTEIIQVVDMLSAFQPDKVLLEYKYNNGDQLQEDYKNYLKGDYQLKVNERDLIGFRLAERLGHDSIFAVDHKLDLPFDTLVRYCEANDKMGDFGKFIEMVQAYTEAETQMLSEMSLPQYFAHMNQTEVDALANDLYLRATADFGEEGNEVGIEAAATWYKRNMYILKNIDRVTKTGERVLLIIGQAHRAVIRDYIEDREDMTYIEVSQFLRSN